MIRCCTGFVIVACICQSSFADPDSLENAEQALRQVEETGRAPGFNEFVDLVNRDGIQLSEVEFFKLRKLLATLQEPEISRSDLRELIAGKRGRIADYVTHVALDEVGDISLLPSRRYELAGSGEKRYQREWLTPGEGQEYVRRVTSFDGQVVRQYRAISNQATIAPSLDTSYRDELVQPTANPIACSMLLDSEADLGVMHTGIDLAAMLESDFTVVFTDRREVDGHSCLVVANFNTVVYLDPELDYSVIRREGWDYDADNDGRFRRRDAFVTLADYRESGGILFPTTITFVNSSTGRRTVADVTKLVINGGVEDSVFTGVIPEGVDTFEIREDGTIVQVDNQ